MPDLHYPTLQRSVNIGKGWHIISPRFCNARKELSRGANNRAERKITFDLDKEEVPGGRPEGAVVADAAVVLLNAVVVVCTIVRNLDTIIFHLVNNDQEAVYENWEAI